MYYKAVRGCFEHLVNTYIAMLQKLLANLN